MMPVAEFPGRFGWGYDGVDLYAPSRLYGTPDDLRAFVDRAHALGIGVILDVVYNHLGPDGNYLAEFSPDYFTDKYTNDWGRALNFEGPAPAREFFVPTPATGSTSSTSTVCALMRRRTSRTPRPARAAVDPLAAARQQPADRSTSSGRTSRRMRRSSGRLRRVASALTRCGMTTSITPPSSP